MGTTGPMLGRPVRSTRGEGHALARRSRRPREADDRIGHAQLSNSPDRVGVICKAFAMAVPTSTIQKAKFCAHDDRLCRKSMPRSSADQRAAIQLASDRWPPGCSLE